MKENLISVIMGVYNIPNKKILEKSIMSILNQTYKNIEFIIIDDGSTNDTYKWLKEITKADNRVVLIKNERNIGLQKTLNKGIKASHGEYIARMDGDDYCSIDRFEKEINFLRENPEFELVSTNSNCFDENGIWGKRVFDEVITKESFLYSSPIQHGAILTYRKCFDLSGMYSEEKYAERNEDYDLFMRMFSKGIKMYTLQEKLYFYRVDDVCFSKRKYKYRITEAKVRAKGYKLLGLYPKGIIYVIKPLIVGLIPINILKRIKKKRG